MSETHEIPLPRELPDTTPEVAELSFPERLLRAGRTGAALARIWLGYRGLAALDRGALHGVVGQARTRWDRLSARTLHDTAVDLGGLLLKAGQFLATRGDVLPPVYTRSLARLQDRVPPHPYAVVREVVAEELGTEPERVFARFWRRPVASASLAQVHRAALHDGRDVAVKVQRPEVAALVRADLRNLRLALAALERFDVPLDLRPLLDELEEIVPRELDFLAEAHNAERIGRDFADDPRVVIPRVVPELTRRRLLVTEYVAGIKVTDRRRLRRSSVEPADILARLVDAYAAQILVRGRFHADPHPGNLLVLPGAEGARIAFVDFGLVEELPTTFRVALLGLAGAFQRREARAVAEALDALGVACEDGAAERLERVGALLIELAERRSRRAGGTRDLTREIMACFRSQPGVRIPARLWLIGRVIGLLWGIGAASGVRLDLFRALERATLLEP